MVQLEENPKKPGPMEVENLMEMQMEEMEVWNYLSIGDQRTTGDVFCAKGSDCESAHG